MLRRSFGPLLACALSLGCGGQGSPPGPARSAAAPGAQAKLPVGVITETLELSAPGTPVDWAGGMALLADGALVVGGSVVEGQPWLDTRARPPEHAGFVLGFDAQLSPRWVQFLRERVRAVVEVAGRLVVVSDAGLDDLTLTTLSPRGERLGEVSLAALSGGRCRRTRADFVHPDQDGGLAIVAGCRFAGAPDAEHVLQLDPQLRVRSAARAVGVPAMDGAAWSIAHADSSLTAVRTAPQAPGWQAVLAQSEAGGRLLRGWPAPVRSPSGGMVYAGTALETMREASGRELPRVRARSFVTSLAPSGRYDRPIFDPMITDDPPAVLTAGLAAADPTLLVALRYTHGTHIEGQPLPAWKAPNATPLEEAIPRLAVLELDLSTGGARAAHVLVPSAEARSLPGDSAVRSVQASPTRLAIRTDRGVFVYPRAPSPPPLPRPTAPPPRIVAPPPLPPPPPVALDSTSPAVLRASWEEVCGPRVLSSKNAPCRLESVAIGADGAVAVAGGYYGANQLGATRLARKAFQTGLLAVYEPTGRQRWHKTLGASWHNGLSDVRVLDDGRVLSQGVHGQGFDAGGKRLPDRALPRDSSSDVGFLARTPYLALYGRDGRLEASDDIDALVLGDRDPSYERACSATLAEPEGDRLLMLSACGGALHRISLRGLDVAARELVPKLSSDAPGWGPLPALDARGRRWLTFRNVFGSSLRVVAETEQGGAASSALFEPAWAPSFWPEPRVVPLARGGALVAVGAREVLLPPPGSSSGAEHTRVLLARVGRDAEPAWTRALVASTTNAEQAPTLAALAVDEHERPVVIVHLSAPAEIAGRAFPAGLVLVRLTPDGARADVAASLEGSASGCLGQLGGVVRGLAVRGGRAAVLLARWAPRTCNVKDEPAAVLSFTLPS